MKRMFLLFSHKLTKEQKADAIRAYGVEDFCYLPESLQTLWSSINPHGKLPTLELDSIVDFLRREGNPGDIVLVQGDFGAVFYVVDACLQLGFLPVYATTWRQSIEKSNPDGSVILTHTFSHVQFRLYEKFRSQ